MRSRPPGRWRCTRSVPPRCSSAIPTAMPFCCASRKRHRAEEITMLSNIHRNHPTSAHRRAPDPPHAVDRDSGTRNLLIIGGGFAGITLAEQLEHRLPPGWKLTLVSQENFITYNPLLPEVVGASIMPGHVVAPLRQMIHCSSVCMAHVSEIDLATKTVHYLGEGSGTLRYDQLVLAVGVQANLHLVRGMAQYALPLKTLGDALFLRNRIIARLEQAELQPDAEARRWLTTFVVIGGGFSGVETAGELIDFLHASLRYYPRIRREDVRVVLLHGQDRLLPELSPTLGDFARRKMCMQGLDVR